MWTKDNERSLKDYYIAVENRLKHIVLDTKIVRGIFNASGHTNDYM